MQIQLSKDVDIIHNIMIEAFSEYIDDEIPSSALEETIETIENDFTNGAYAMIGYYQEQPVASVRFKIIDDYLYFYRLSVLPSFQGNGFAKKLLHALENYAIEHQIDQLQCNVRMTVPRNVQLYRSLGYQLMDEQLLQRRDGQHLKIVSMTKTLSEKKILELLEKDGE